MPLVLAVALFVSTAAWSQSTSPTGPRRDRQFPPGSLRQIEDLPPGSFRNKLDRLNPTARQKSLEWLQRFHFTEIDLDSLDADEAGGIFYVDNFTTDPTPQQTEPPITSEAAVPVSPFPASLVYHSRPGAPNILYLNFAGEDVTGTAWNTSLNRTTIPAVAFSSDADYSTYSESEQAVIKRVWQRVAEDYAPFNIDVTTERPATFTTRTAHALITRNTDANGAANPSTSAGGVAYVNVFAGGSYATYRPAWVYCNNLANDDSYIAEATSHEIGHNLGLSHDAKTDGTSYYGGHGSGDTSWGPIMGTGYNRNVSQWSKGEYYLANNTEDDLATIVGKLTYRTDDHGNTRASATPLILTSGTNVVSTTPESDPTNTNSANKGVLAQSSDVDVFSFATGNGQVSLTVNPWISPTGMRGGDLDVLLELYNESGTLLLTNNSSSTTYASIVTNLTEGLYFLNVRNTGVGTPLSSTPNGYTAYASIGQYFISGRVTASGYIIPPQAELSVTAITETETGAKQFTVTYSDNMGVAVSTIDNNDIRVTGPHGYDRTAQFVSVDNAANGTPRVATYSVNPPVGSVWLNADNGTYTVWLKTNQVSDTEGSWVSAQQLGQFDVNVPALLYADDLDVNSGWTFQGQWQYGTPAEPSAGPTSGFTGTKVVGYNLTGNYPNNLAMVYATMPAINCANAADLSLRFARWLRLRNGDTANIQVSTNGTTWTTVWSTTSTVSDTSWQELEYPLPAWTGGSPTVLLRWGMGSGSSQNDIGWNIDDVELLGTGNINTAIPNYTLAASANNPAWGSVNPVNGTYPGGSSVQVTATPASYYRFINWTGYTSATNNPLTVVLNTNASLLATFSEIITTNHPTPYWWLASYGYQQNFESAAQSIGNNGIPLWQSYIAGLNPTNPASQLKLSLARPGGGNSLALNWNTVTGRVYSVWSSTNLLTGFVPVSNATNLPATVAGFTNTISGSTPRIFYRLEVKKL